MTKLSETEVACDPRSSTDAFCKDLIEGMHAASQPLTILRASLGSTDVTRQSVQDLRKLLRRSSKEVQRLCILFNYLQQFVVVESIQAEPEVEELSRLIDHALDGVNLLFVEAGVILTLERNRKSSLYVLADISRLGQALSSILLVVLGRSQRGDEVVVTIHVPGARIDIAIMSSLPPSPAMNAETRLSMALAAANLRSQGAQMAWEQTPFAVQITLPVANMAHLA